MNLDRIRLQQQILARRYALELHNKVLGLVSKNDDPTSSHISSPLPSPAAQVDRSRPPAKIQDQK